MATKNTYATSLIVATQIGLLPERFLETIPASTISGWRKYEIRKVIGLDCEDPILHDLDFHRQFLNVGALRATAKALFRIYKFYESIIANVRGVKRIWKASKAEIVELVRRIQPAFGLERACRMARISVSCFHNWKNDPECANSPIGVCRKRHPLQISIVEEKIIKQYATNPEYAGWSLASLWLQILRDGAAAFSVTTFRKYVRILQIIRPKFRKPRRRIGIRADAPLVLLHMDTTVFRTADRTKFFVHLIVDNFSRAILGWRLMRTNNSKDVMENLSEVCEAHDLMRSEVTVLTDDGSENLGQVSDFFQRPGNFMKKLVAQVDIDFSNSMVEAVNKVLKYQFLFPKGSRLRTGNDLRRALEIEIERYNNRPQFVLHGLTPREVLAGRIPDP
ncbi:MAG: DDE-type integrase/transposase/recombinase, partial [bacterium]|nr:DDE-type integrase/transposase/recombinase [bacterium]